MDRPCRGEPYGNGDVVGCTLDCDARTVSYTKNGKDLGVAFQIPDNLAGQALFPAVCLKNAECHVNFGGGGASSFKFPPPAGYAGVAAASPGQFRAGGRGPESIHTHTPPPRLHSVLVHNTHRAHSLFTPSTTIYIVYWCTTHTWPIVYSHHLPQFT